MKNKEAIIEQLKKVKELSERGIDGERASAEKLLKKLLKKYNMNLEDLTQDSKEVYEFTFKNQQQKTLIYNIVGKVLNTSDFDSYKIRSDKDSERYEKRYKTKSRGFELTKAQFVEVCELRDFYFELFDVEFEKMKKMILMSFLHKHDIFPDSQEDSEEEESENPYSFEDLMLMRKMSSSMQNKSYTKKIESAK